MKPDEIRNQNIDKALDTPLVYSRRNYALFSGMFGMALLVIAVLLVMQIDVLSWQGLLILVVLSGSAGLVSRWISDRLQPRRKRFVVAFSAPRWDAQLAAPVEIDTQGSTYFVDNSPAIQTTRQDEWIGFKLSSGVTTYILAEDLDPLSAANRDIQKVKE
jgi:hypothetical protein